jgi:hypothetical protein
MNPTPPQHGPGPSAQPPAGKKKSPVVWIIVLVVVLGCACIGGLAAVLFPVFTEAKKVAQEIASAPTANEFEIQARQELVNDWIYYEDGEGDEMGILAVETPLSLSIQGDAIVGVEPSEDGPDSLMHFPLEDQIGLLFFGTLQFDGDVFAVSLDLSDDFTEIIISLDTADDLVEMHYVRSDQIRLVDEQG